MREKKNLYLKLFISTFNLSAFTFGGGYVIISFMKKKFVDELHWLKEDEMLNMVAIAQSSPGAIAVNAAILVGYRIAGVTGTLIAILGTILPPLIILSAVSLFYTAFKTNSIVSAVLKGMQAGVAAVIADTVISMGSTLIKGKNILSILIMIGAFTANFVFHINVIYIILVCGIIGALQAVIKHIRESKKSEDSIE